MPLICHMVSPSLLLTGFGEPNSTNGEIRIILTLTPCPPLNMRLQTHGISTSRRRTGSRQWRNFVKASPFESLSWQLSP